MKTDRQLEQSEVSEVLGAIIINKRTLQLHKHLICLAQTDRQRLLSPQYSDFCQNQFTEPENASKFSRLFSQREILSSVHYLLCSSLHYFRPELGSWVAFIETICWHFTQTASRALGNKQQTQSQEILLFLTILHSIKQNLPRE